MISQHLVSHSRIDVCVYYERKLWRKAQESWLDQHRHFCHMHCLVKLPVLTLWFPVNPQPVQSSWNTHSVFQRVCTTVVGSRYIYCFAGVFPFNSILNLYHTEFYQNLLRFTLYYIYVTAGVTLKIQITNMKHNKQVNRCISRNEVTVSDSTFCTQVKVENIYLMFLQNCNVRLRRLSSSFS